ncbi:hypothetical protein HDU85_007645 [Gaertneriomyces sp. JEL0708]|nr:hypothetical protein HDU85_007645 [Gaertneriomyces sp. JEL0708]
MGFGLLDANQGSNLLVVADADDPPQAGTTTPSDADTLKRQSTGSQDLELDSTGSGKRVKGPHHQRFSQIEVIPGVKVRDFAYALTDPRHYGLPLLDNSNRSSRSSVDSDWPSSSSDEGDASYSSSERLFESDDERRHGTSVPTSVSHVDFHQVVLPALAKEIAQHMQEMDVMFYKAKAMFDFNKVTEWEMSICEGDELVIAVTRTQSTTTNNEEEQQSRQHARDPSEASMDNSATPRGSVATGLNERWASIDEIEKDAETRTSDIQSAKLSTDSLSQGASAVTLHSDPSAQDLAGQLTQLLDYAEVYGEGWVTALRIKCKGRLSGDAVGDETTSTGNGSPGVKTDERFSAKKGKVRIKLVDMGLIPGNYIERVEVDAAGV